MKKILTLIILQACFPLFAQAAFLPPKMLNEQSKVCEEYTSNQNGKKSDPFLNLLHEKCIDQYKDDSYFDLLGYNPSNRHFAQNLNKNTYLISTRLTFLNLLIGFNSYLYSSNVMSEEDLQFAIATSDKLSIFYSAKSLAINSEINDYKMNADPEVLFVISNNEQDLHQKILNQFEVSNKYFARLTAVKKKLPNS